MIKCNLLNKIHNTSTFLQNFNDAKNCDSVTWYFARNLKNVKIGVKNTSTITQITHHFFGTMRRIPRIAGERARRRMTVTYKMASFDNTM